MCADTDAVVKATEANLGVEKKEEDIDKDEDCEEGGGAVGTAVEDLLD